MSKVLLLSLFVCLGAAVYAQHTDVKRSNEMVALNGRIYYIHVVEHGETLFSIAKAYGVELDELKRINGKSDTALSLGEVLHIPYIEPYKPLDDTYYYHKMRPKETLFSLSQRYGIKLRRILKDNPEYDESKSVPIGAIVRLNLKQIDNRVLEADLLWMQRQSQSEKEQQIIERLAEREQQQEDIATELPSFDYDDIKDNYIKISILLPFEVKANKIPAPDEIDRDSIGNNIFDEGWRLNRGSLSYTNFLNGFLLAADSLKHLGYELDIQLLDTEGSIEGVAIAADKVRSFAPHLIIGPGTPEEFRAFTGYLGESRVPVIYPFNLRESDDLGSYQGAVRIGGSTDALLSETATWIVESSRFASVIAITSENSGYSVFDDLEGRIRDILPFGEQCVKNISWAGKSSISSLIESMSSVKENIILVPTVDEKTVTEIFPQLYSLTNRYKITLIGLPKWLEFTSLDTDMIFGLNMKIIQPNPTPLFSDTQSFTQRFRMSFYSEPRVSANRAFDIGMFFVPFIVENGVLSLDRLVDKNENRAFNNFKFCRSAKGGVENRGLYLVHYTSDFMIDVKPLK